MHIGIVGGLDRNEALYEELARRAGHRLEWHTGDLSGRGAQTLAKLIGRCDVVIVVTDVNSHGAVWRVRRLTKLQNRRCLLMSRCGTSKFSKLLEGLSAEEQRAAI